MALSNEAKARMLDTLDGSYLSLHDGDPSTDGGNEIFGGRYSRKEAKFSKSSDGEKLLATEILFDGMPRSMVSHYGLWTSKSGGKFLVGGNLSEARQLNAGDASRLIPGSIAIIMD